jgi:hypothetical protein
MEQLNLSSNIYGIFAVVMAMLIRVGGIVE